MKKKTKKAARRKLSLKQRRQLLKHAERCVYDVQKWRIRAGHRAEEVETEFSLFDKRFFAYVEEEMTELEVKGTRRLETLLRGIPIWEQFLKPLKGIGPKMGALLVAETNIENCHTPSKLWAWWGLHVVKGKAVQKNSESPSKFSPFRKAKAVKVLAELMLLHKTPVYYDLYREYKARKAKQVVKTCMACGGTGKAHRWNKAEGQREEVQCWNCNGTGGPAPWGITDEHRHRAACRYMVKRLLLDMWKAWRTLEGLDMPPSYAEVQGGTR
jgi:hypothetical protein